MRPARSARCLLATIALLGALPLYAAEFRDDFSNPASGWPHGAATRDTDLGFAVYTDSGAYQLTPVQDDVFGFMPAPRQSESGDLRMQSDLFLYAGIGAGAGGLACRYQDGRNFYAFMVRGDRVLQILRIVDGVATSLAQGSVESIMQGTVDTRIEARCEGDQLSMAVRGGSSLQARDSSLRGGQAGVFVIGQSAAGTSAVFDNVVLQLP